MQLSHITKVVDDFVTKYLVVRAFKPDGHISGYKIVCENNSLHLVGIASTLEELGKIGAEFRSRLGTPCSSHYFTVIKGVDGKDYDSLGIGAVVAGYGKFDSGEPVFRSQCASCRAPHWDVDPRVRRLACDRCPVAA